MCRASGACVLSTWHVKSTRCISTVKVLLYRLSSCVVCLDTISQPSHLPRVHCHKGMVCQRGGEHIYIYIYVFCLFLSLSLCLSVSLHASIHPSISIDESPDWRLPFQLPCQGHPRKALHPKFFRKKRSVRLTILWF